MSSWFKDLRVGKVDDVQPPAQPSGLEEKEEEREIQLRGELRRRKLEAEIRMHEAEMQSHAYASGSTIKSLFFVCIVAGILYVGVWAAPKAVEYGQHLRVSFPPESPVGLGVQGAILLTGTLLFLVVNGMISLRLR